MQSALYYPFTNPKRDSFWKTALFLWDTVDFIVPYADFRPYTNSDESQEALEILGRNYVPTEHDKQHAHEELEALCNDSLPERLYLKVESRERPYGFYPEKLLPETWDMLAESGLAKVARDANHADRTSTAPLFGYYMMSILALCCSQGRKRLVTDENDAYRTLSNSLVDSNDQVAGARSSWHERLVALRLNGPSFAEVPLGRLIDLRKNEDKLLQDLRRQFLRAVDQTVSDICLHAENENTVRDLIGSFNDTMEKDLVELKRALWRSATSTLLSKEFGFSLLAVTAPLAPGLESFAGVTTAAAVATIGGLVRNLMDYQDRRRCILRGHPSAWFLTGDSAIYTYCVERDALGLLRWYRGRTGARAASTST